MRVITKVILHCSAFSKPHDITTVRAWHLARGWKDVGYHFFIKFDGSIQEGRSVFQIGAHCKGQNANSIGICLAGLHPEDFTAAQMKSLKALLRDIKATVAPNCSLHGHFEFEPNKTCPVFDCGPLKAYWRTL